MIHRGFRYGEPEHEHYREQGYYLFDHCLSDEGLALCRREIDRMLGQLHPTRAPERIHSAHHQEPWLFELAREPALLEMIERQVGPDIVLWSSHVLCKAPRTGKEVPWHQDAPYWDIRGQLSGGLWIALDDIDARNGSMAVLPGWHTKGTLPIRSADRIFFPDEIDPAALPADIDDRKVEYRMKAGQAAIHHPMIPHNSRPNRSDRWRRVIVLRYMAADAVMGPFTYEDYRTLEPFPREGFLVRGRDVAGRSWRRSPVD